MHLCQWAFHEVTAMLTPTVVFKHTGIKILHKERQGRAFHRCIAVELKVTFDFRALQQAALRQKLIDTVYTAQIQ